MSKFSIGDRVKFQNFSIQYTSIKISGSGTIICYDDGGFYGIRFDDARRGLFHTLGGRCDQHHGFYVRIDNVEKYCELIEPDNQADIPLDEFMELIAGYSE